MILPKHNPRRPYDEKNFGLHYMEGDNDYFENNKDLAVALMDAYGEGRVTLLLPATLEKP